MPDPEAQRTDAATAPHRPTDPTAAHEPTGRAVPAEPTNGTTGLPAESDPGMPGSGQLRRLRWLGIAGPVILVLAFEAMRAAGLEPLVGTSIGHLISAVVLAVGAGAFGLAMFALIDHAHRQIVRKNRELAAVNAVSTALQGELAVDDVIDSALRSIVASTEATEASVTIFAQGSEGEGSGGVTRRVGPGTDAAARRTAARAQRLVDIPLTTGTTVVGRLRLQLPADAGDPDLLTSNALANIGHQIAGAVQTTQLLADLQRRKSEGHAFYDVLLQISSQYPLADVLGAITRYARDLMRADEATMGLAEPVSHALDREGATVSLVPLGDGTFCVTPDPDHFRNAHEGRVVCPIRSAPDLVSVLEVPLISPDGSLGDIWIGRRTGPAYTPRDRAFLATLARLATIAITSARARDSERQTAVLAERDRIAREMHDSLAQVLGMTHLRLRSIVGRDEVIAIPRTRTDLVDIADITEEAYRDVREAILGLRESSHVRGLVDSLEAYLAKYAHQSGVHASLDAVVGDPQLPADAEIQVIRVIQEALTNVRKHAHATSVVVRIAPDEADGFVSIVIEDDGRGFDLGGTLLESDGGFGLHTMRERMELVGGTLSIESSPLAGTRVIARVPSAIRATASPVLR